MGKGATILLILILLIPTAFAIDPPPQPNPAQTTSLEDIKATIIQQSIQTRAEITAYSDRKISEMITTMRTDGQKFIDDNYAILDKRIQEIALKLAIKIVLGTFFVIIFSQSIWYLIKRAIDKKDRHRPREINKDTYLANKYGLITPEKQAELDQEDKTIIKKEALNENRLQPPIPPSISEIEKIMLRNKMMANKKIKKQLDKEIALKEKEEKKLAEKILKKSQRKIFNNTDKLELKLQKIEEQKQALELKQSATLDPEMIDIDEKRLTD